jgi:hypothetical protein
MGLYLGMSQVFKPGTFFRSRRELHDKKLHRGLMNGIATRGEGQQGYAFIREI